MLGTSKNIWGFDPRSVPGCSLWLDGADSNSMTLSGSNVTAWTDKSPLSTAFTLSNGSGGSTIRTTYTGFPVVQVSNSCFFNGSYSYPLATRSIFFVMAETVHSDWRGLLSFASNADQSDYNTQNGYTITATNTVGSNVQFSQNFGNGGFNFNYNASNGTKDVPFQLYEDVTSNTAVTLFITGSNVYSSNTSVTPLTSTGLTVGGRNGIPNTGALVIAEVLLYSNVLTTSQRQQVEGYLSHKWGLNGYYDSSIPLSIPGCQLWLDAADTSSMTLSGSNVTQWRDKSGYINHFTPTSGTPTSISDNGRNVVNFTSGAIMTSTNQITFTTSSAFFIVSKLTSLSAATISMLVGFTNIYSGDYTFVRYNPSAILNGTAATTGSENDLGNNNYYVNGTFNPSTFGSSTYLNTYSLIGTVAPILGGTSFLTLSSAFMSRFFIGNIAEFLYYPGGVTSSQRQSIEGYLARKWGLTSMYSALPSIHPFSSIRPHLRTFQPTDIPGCQLWLDAADSSTLVLSGSNVTQWSDKSGNGRNGTLFQNYPTYTTNRVNFNGTQGLATSLSPSTNIESGFVICGFTSVSSVNTLIGSFVSENGGRQFRVNNAIQTIKQDIVAVLTSGTSLENNTTYLCEYVNNGTTLTHYLNGNSYASGGSVTYTAGGNITSIGYRSNNNGYNEGLYGYIQEVLIFSTALTTSQRQQIEGYLAHKWELTPSYSSTTPLSISGCTLWLDGADPAATGVQPSNGATVSTWVDKSGNGRNGIQYSSFARPTFLTNSLNSRGGISFSASSSNCYQTATILPTPRALFVVGFSSNDGFILSGIPTPNSGHPPYYATFARDVEYGVNNTSDQAFLANVASTANVNYILTGLYTGSNVTTIMNGGTLSNTVSFSGTPKTPATTLIGINSYNGSLGAPLTGTINEFIAFNTDLTTTQRQSIEGYLARKWGISISATLPSLHPFKSFPPAKAPMIIGLVNRWIFNNGSGSTVTDTVGGQNISLSGTYTWSSSVPNSEIAIGSLSFDGYSGTGSAAVNATLQTSTYTMTLWYYHTGVSDPYGGNPMILQSGFNQNEAFSFATGGFTGTSKPYFYSSVYNGGFGRTFSSATPLNTWTHLAVTIGNSTYNAYQNGVLDSGNTNISITSGLPLTLNGSFIFAKGDSAYGNRFGGSLFDVRIYNRALSASEISQIYNGIG
jgi:hypothetical protein